MPSSRNSSTPPLAGPRSAEPPTGALAIRILDELGYVPCTKAGAELLFEVVSRAYERTSLLVTTNLPFESWTDVLGTERLTGALLDRLTHRIHTLEANGESYRLRESRRRLRQRPAARTNETET